MKSLMVIGSVCVMTCLLLQPADAQTDVVSNGSFESGISGWTFAKDASSPAGTCGFNVAAAPGTETTTSTAGFAATDGANVALGGATQTGAGDFSCVLYQDVAIPAGATTASFSIDTAIKYIGGKASNNAAVFWGLYSTASVPSYYSIRVKAFSPGMYEPASSDTTLHHFPATGVDVSSLAGTTVRLAIIAASNSTTGAAVVGIDNVKLLVTVAPAITSANAATFTVGSAGTFTVTTTGSPVAAISSTGPLPTGVTFVDNNNGTATLGGTAAYGQGGVYTLTITAANGVASQASQTFTLTVGSVTTFSGPTATGTGTATASISGGSAACTFLGDAAFVSASSVSAPAPAQFPHGLFSFTLRGCTGTVTMTITYPSVLPLGSGYWKYGPQSKGATPSWYEFVAAPGTATATYTLALADNSLGDDDWDTTTDIVDQGGPGLPAEAIPALGGTGLVLLACLLTIAGSLVLRRMGS